jgi:hypothetical protein
MRTRVLPLGTAFVLRTTMPVQADRPVPDHLAYLQFPTDLQRRHPSPMPAVGGLNIHAGTLPSTPQDQSPAAHRVLPRPWWADDFARRR